MLEPETPYAWMENGAHLPARTNPGTDEMTITIARSLREARRLITAGESFEATGDGWRISCVLKRGTWHCEFNADDQLATAKLKECEARMWIRDWWPQD